MICRHAPGDRSCSSYSYSPPATKTVYKDKIVYRDKLVPITPDADNYTIQQIHREGPHLVVKAKYPNCAKCSYEGTKIMVFLNVSEIDVMKWKEIDPHFRDPKKNQKYTAAPGPAARFPASPEGWKDAIAYVQYKCGKHKQVHPPIVQGSKPRDLWNKNQ